MNKTKHTPTPEETLELVPVLIALWRKYPLDFIVRAVNSHEALLGQLKQSQAELKVGLEMQGDCDHSVGVCSCPLIRLIEGNEGTIAQAEMASNDESETPEPNYPDTYKDYDE